MTFIPYILAGFGTAYLSSKLGYDNMSADMLITWAICVAPVLLMNLIKDIK